MFVQVEIETSGVGEPQWQSLHFLSDLGLRLQSAAKEPNAFQYLMQVLFQQYKLTLQFLHWVQ